MQFKHTILQIHSQNIYCAIMYILQLSKYNTQSSSNLQLLILCVPLYVHMNIYKELKSPTTMIKMCAECSEIPTYCFHYSATHHSSICTLTVPATCIVHILHDVPTLLHDHSLADLPSTGPALRAILEW